jgi:hypothetical protein
MSRGFNAAHAVTGWPDDVVVEQEESLASDPSRWPDQATSVPAMSEELLPQTPSPRAPPPQAWPAPGVALNGQQQQDLDHGGSVGGGC